MTQIDETIASYLTALKIEGKSPKTIESYANSLEDFRRVGERLGLPDTVEGYGVEHVYQFLGALQKHGASPGYQHRRHREVQTLFSWCERMGVVEQNVFKRVPRIKVGERIRPPFAPAEVRLLLDSQDRSRHRGSRNYALILFLLDTGVRASECLGVEIEDIAGAHQRVLICHGKGQRQRWVGIGERALGAIRDYIERFRGDRPGELFLTSRGEAMSSVGTLEVILRRVGERTGVQKVHPHRFWHTFATWAIQSGAREIDVQLLLGHSDLTMTQRYARTYTSEQAVRAHAALSPVGQLASTWPDVAPATSGRSAEDRAPDLPLGGAQDLRFSPDGVSHPVRSEAARASPNASLIREEERVTTTKSAIKAGLTLVAKYKGEQYTCEIVEQDGALRFVLPDGRTLKSPSAAGRAITTSQVNGYRFWTIPEKPPVGQGRRQRAAQLAATAQA